MNQIKKIIQIFSEFARDFPIQFASLFILLLMEGIVATGSVLSLVPMADYLLDSQLNDPSKITLFFLNVFNSFGIPIGFWTFGIFFVICNLLNGISKVMIRYLILKIKYAILRSLYSKTLDAFLKSRLSFFDSSGQGRLLNTLNRELNIIGDTLGHIATQFSQVVQLVVYMAVPFWLNVSMTSIALFLALLFAIPFMFLSRISYDLGKINTKTSNQLMGVLSEIIQAIRIIIGFGRQSESKVRFAKAFDAHVDATMKSQVLSATVSELYRPLGISAVIIALGVSVNNEASISESAAVLWSFLSALPILTGLLRTHISINNFIPSYEQLVSLRETASANKEVEGANIFIKLKSDIVFSNVSFSYPKRKETLTDINLTIRKNRMTALVGESGSGKSTIIDLLLGLQIPIKGEVLLDNIPLSDWKQNSFREKVGYIPQDPILFNTSIRNNLLWSKETANEEELYHSLELANAKFFVQQLPMGIDTIVGDRGVLLSGGQRQRIALARALLRQPEILILDEATSSLDTESEKSIKLSIDTLSKKMTILIVAHRLSTISSSDYVYVLQTGQVVEEGQYKDLASNLNSIFSFMLMNQSKD